MALFGLFPSQRCVICITLKRDWSLPNGLLVGWKPALRKLARKQLKCPTPSHPELLFVSRFRHFTVPFVVRPHLSDVPEAVDR